MEAFYLRSYEADRKFYCTNFEVNGYFYDTLNVQTNDESLTFQQYVTAILYSNKHGLISLVGYVYNSNYGSGWERIRVEGQIYHSHKYCSIYIVFYLNLMRLHFCFLPLTIHSENIGRHSAIFD